MNVLAIEDDREILNVVRMGLSEAGMHCDVAETGGKGEKLMSSKHYDAIVLDLMLPDADGLDILRRMRARGVKTPVVILSALGSTSDKIDGLSEGADDYLSKPFAIDELVVRIRTVLRRTMQAEEDVLTFKDLSLDTKRKVALRNGRTIILTDLEYKLLEFLMRNPGRRMTAGLILEKVWNFDTSMTNVVEARIYALRKKLNEKGEENLIVNSRGRGYALQ